MRRWIPTAAVLWCLGLTPAAAGPENPELQELYVMSIAREGVSDSARLDAWWHDHEIWLSGIVGALEGFALEYGKRYEEYLNSDCPDRDSDSAYSMYSINAARLLDRTIERFLLTNDWLEARRLKAGEVVIADFVERFRMCVDPGSAPPPVPPPGQASGD